MQIRRLTLNDYHHLEHLVEERVKKSESILPEFFKPEDITEESIQEYKTRWLEGMKTYYLPDSLTHDLYGAFDDDGVLTSCMSWRSDLPEPWSDGWVVGNLKALPGKTFMRNGILQLWRTMFEVCEGKGLKRWHMMIVENNRNRYQSIADRYFKDFDSTYDYDWSFVIPANTQPEVDWVWGTMGRMLLNTEIRVRTGTKK